MLFLKDSAKILLFFELTKFLSRKMKKRTFFTHFSSLFRKKSVILQPQTYKYARFIYNISFDMQQCLHDICLVWPS